ncbi:MAG: beta-ketoacyl synthase N-terminal-like domain-containing protein, partial [Rhizobiaceae bacterium]
MTRQRIVITGLGGLCALGTDVASIWQGMRDGRSAIGEISTPFLRDVKTRIGAEIKQLPEWDVDRRRLEAIDRFSQLAAMSAEQAMKQSGIAVADMDDTRVGAV